MAVTTFEKGVQQGVQQGLQQGERRVLQKQLEVRFGPLNLHAEERLKSLSAERLEELALRILDARSLKELGLEASARTHGLGRRQAETSGNSARRRKRTCSGALSSSCDQLRVGTKLAWRLCVPRSAFDKNT